MKTIFEIAQESYELGIDVDEIITREFTHANEGVMDIVKKAAKKLKEFFTKKHMVYEEDIDLLKTKYMDLSLQIHNEIETEIKKLNFNEISDEFKKKIFRKYSKENNTQILNTIINQLNAGEEVPPSPVLVCQEIVLSMEFVENEYKSVEANYIEAIRDIWRKTCDKYKKDKLLPNWLDLVLYDEMSENGDTMKSTLSIWLSGKTKLKKVEVQQLVYSNEELDPFEEMLNEICAHPLEVPSFEDVANELDTYTELSMWEDANEAAVTSSAGTLAKTFRLLGSLLNKQNAFKSYIKDLKPENIIDGISDKPSNVHLNKENMTWILTSIEKLAGLKPEDIPSGVQEKIEENSKKLSQARRINKSDKMVNALYPILTYLLGKGHLLSFTFITGSSIALSLALVVHKLTKDTFDRTGEDEMSVKIFKTIEADVMKIAKVYGEPKDLPNALNLIQKATLKINAIAKLKTEINREEKEAIVNTIKEANLPEKFNIIYDPKEQEAIGVAKNLTLIGKILSKDRILAQAITMGALLIDHSNAILHSGKYIYDDLKRY